MNVFDFLLAVQTIQRAAKEAGCVAEIVINGDQLASDNETWTIGDQTLPNLPEWQDERNSKPII